MVSVSDKFKALSQDNGRRVYCRIEAGTEVFYDDRITEFEFDDVAHGDWFTLGSACSNRFYFKAEFSGNIAVGDVVRPYISFDGEEWCPLGVFYASRRYFRGNSVSVVCYDRFYSLDMEYESGVTLPAASDIILRDICAQYGLPCENFGDEFVVNALPECATVRDMIGYIAAINRSCARFDRYGKLVFKTTEAQDFYLQEKNCVDITRNMTKSVITCITADTGNEVLAAGSGAEISTLELYNPLITQERVDKLLELMRPFSFYGAEIEMQGLPFLEAGDVIKLAEKSGLYTIVLSEIIYRYDGGLFAKAYSKNRSYTDAVVHEDDLADELEKLRKLFSAMCLKYTNDSQIAIGETPQDAVVFAFETAGESFAQLDLNFTVSDSSAEDLIVDVFVNGEQIPRRAVHHFTENGEKSLLHYYFLADGLRKGQNTIAAKLSVTSGSAYILPKQFIGTIVAHGAAASGDLGFKRSLYEMFTKTQLCCTDFAAADFTARAELTEE